jgi:hypothetical protein
MGYTESEVRYILQSGVFSIRHTMRITSGQLLIGMSLEQTVNRNAVSQMKSFVAFRNYENALLVPNNAQRTLKFCFLGTFSRSRTRRKCKQSV